AAQPDRLPAEHPAISALQQGRRTLAQRITPALIDAVVADEDHRRVVEQLAPCSLLAVPIQSGRRIHGALVLAQAESGREYEPEDLDLAVELARRAALTIENAQL